MTPSGVDAGAAGEPCSAASEANSNGHPQPTGGTGLPLPNVSVWARWVLGSVFWFTVPLYNRILGTEEVVEKTVEEASEVAEALAKVVKKVSADVAIDLPEGGRLRMAALEVEGMADVVIVYAEEVDAFMHKVDEVKEEVEEAMEPIIKEIETIETKGKQNEDLLVG